MNNFSPVPNSSRGKHRRNNSVTRKKIIKGFTFSIMLQLIFILGQSCITSYRFTSKYAEQLKNEKAIITTLEYPKRKKKREKLKEEIDRENKLGTEILNNTWKYSSIHDEKPREEARKFIRKNKGYHLIISGTYVAFEYKKSSKHAGNSVTITNFSTGMRIEMSTGKIIAFPFPFTDNDNFINEISVLAASKSLQEILRQIESGVIPDQKEMFDNSKRNTGQLKTKTLLLPEFLFDKELGVEGIKPYYESNIEVCSSEKYEEAIKTGLSGYIVPLVSTDIYGLNYLEQLTLWDSETWECYAAIPYKGLKYNNLGEFNGKNYEDNVKLKKEDWKRIAKQLK